MGAIAALSATHKPRAVAQVPGSAVHMPDRLPVAFRLVHLDVVQDGDRVHCAADLYHRCAALSVIWSAPTNSPEIEVGALVRPEFPMLATTRGGPLAVANLSVLQQPERDLNLFETMRPERWRLPQLIERARILIDALPPVYRHLFNAIFWDHHRFARFCVSPGSMHNHHAQRSGLLLHSIETAEIALSLCDRSERVNRGLALIAALLHDAGKADEYLLDGEGASGLSNRGKLVGHGITVTEWIAAAVAANPAIDLGEENHQALIHVLTARTSAPEWLGIRKSAMIENEIVSFADRLSGQLNLHDQLSAAEGGWGRRHRHRQAPFTLLDTV